MNTIIQPKYVARLETRVTYEIIEIAEIRGIRPDVGIYESELIPFGESSAVVITPAPVQSVVPLEIPLKLLSIEIRLVDMMQLITAIEILSPVNKRPAHEAYQSYLRKRRELLRSEAHLLEIDLLRGGTPSFRNACTHRPLLRYPQSRRPPPSCGRMADSTS